MLLFRIVLRRTDSPAGEPEFGHAITAVVLSSLSMGWQQSLALETAISSTIRETAKDAGIVDDRETLTGTTSTICVTRWR